MHKQLDGYQRLCFRKMKHPTMVCKGRYLPAIGHGDQDPGGSVIILLGLIIAEGIAMLGEGEKYHTPTLTRAPCASACGLG